jgi:hypothetical protein
VAEPVFLFTDFGPHGPYLGQMRAVLARAAPEATVIDLVNDAPRFDPLCAAHLLAALLPELPVGSLVLAVVDPGVGTATREPVFLDLDGRRLVGPDNGLFHVAAARAETRRRWVIRWRPGRLSASFHGRDLFAPVAAALWRGERPASREAPWAPGELEGAGGDLARVVYRDVYGNLMTGIGAAGLGRDRRLAIAGREAAYAETFGAVAPGALLWYANSLGLVEVAANQASAGETLGVGVGAPVGVLEGPGPGAP